MIRTALKGLLAHRLRLAATALAIVLGVAFVSGTYVFTDTINARFDTLFTDVYSGVDASVRPVPPEFGTGTTRDLPQELAGIVAAISDVAVAEPIVGGVAQIIAPNGDPIGGQGPPTIGGSWVETAALNPTRIADGNGRAPIGPGEVVIDVATADSYGFAVGDTIEVQFITGTESFEVVGLLNFGTEDNLAGATLAYFDFEEAQRVFGMEGRISQIDVLGAEGVDQETLVAEIAPLLPDGVEAVTGDTQTQEQLDRVTEGLGFLTIALLAFAGVAIFVGAFIIQNTFRIIIAQRTRELALLRAIGATGRQVVGMVAVEAVAVALVASAIGVGAGIGVAGLIRAAMNGAGFGMPDGPLTVELRTIVVGMAVGVVVTLVSALLPARRASSVPPVAAMGETNAATSATSLRGRMIGGTATSLIGSAGIGAGLMAENGSSLPLVATGSIVLFIGTSMLAPLFARPIARVVGGVFRGVTGKLARENTVRQPRRTAATASALMIGVALVSFVAIFAASIKASVSDTIDGAFPADLALSSTNVTTGLSPEAIESVDELTETDAVSSIAAGVFRVDGEILNVAAIDPKTVGRAYDPEASIDLAAFDGGLLVHAATAEERGWAVGDTILAEFPTGKHASLELTGTFEDQTFANYLMTIDDYVELVDEPVIQIAFVALAANVDIEEGRMAVEDALATFPSIDVNTRSDQIAEAEASIDQLVALFSGLLGLAVVIAVLGIANTLALSIVERTREIGLLRAVGMTRRQLGSMIRRESVIIALFGAVLGVTVGIGLGWAVVSSLADDGLGSFALPIAQLAMWLMAAAVAGVLAAILPARTAGRLDVLRAVSYE